MVGSQSVPVQIMKWLATSIVMAIVILGCKPNAESTLSKSGDVSATATVSGEAEAALSLEGEIEPQHVRDKPEPESVAATEVAADSAESVAPVEDSAVEDSAEEDSAEEDSAEEDQPEEHNPEIASPDQPDLPVDAAWKPLTDTGLIWIEPESNSVIASGKVCMREGPLEMFACPPNTKEYESVIMVNCPAFMIHGALLAVGAEPGSPVSFNPYKGATGPVIDIFVEWLDEDGTKRRERAQEWIRHNKTGKPMEFDFVFGGSGFWTDEETGKQNYFAEGGELICVSNFSTATMDLPVESPQDNQGLWFTAFTDKIPKLETKVHLILVPRLGARKP